jgi:hypothetical protein
MEQPKQTANTGRAPDEVSLVRGGPFYRVQELTRLLTAERWNAGRRIVFAIAVGWIPLLLITWLFNPQSVGGLLTDYPINIRMLVGVPVLLLGQAVMDRAFRTMVRHIREVGLLASADLTRMDRVTATLIRLRDSWIPEILIVVAVYAHVSTMVGAHIGFARAWTVTNTGTAVHLSPAGWYYAVVSQLIFQFLIGLNLWKWFLWTVFLFRLSKLDLQLVPTHPDQHAGIGFLGMSPLAIAPTAFAIAAAIGGTWRTQILRQGAHLMNFKIEAIVLLLIIVLIAMGPLVFFVPRLARLRRQGILDYGTLGQIHSTDFHRKWVLNRKDQQEDFLTAPEISTLTDYATSYENVEKLQPFPLDKGALMALVLAVAIPLFPVVLAEIPLATVLKSLLSALK